MQVARLSHHNSSLLRNPHIASCNVEGWQSGYSDVSDSQGKKGRIVKGGENIIPAIILDFKGLIWGSRVLSLLPPCTGS